jgi:protein involved in polysaccharide export with SLBB domain
MRDITDVLGADLAKRLYDDGSLGNLSSFIGSELMQPRPTREKIANAKPPVKQEEQPARQEVTVNIGDRVRLVVPDQRRR